MEYAIFDLLRTSLVPELRTDIATGTTCNVHLILVAVATLRAFPYELTVVVSNDLNLAIVSTALAIITLSVELGVHDVLIDVLQYAHNSFKVVLHIRYFNIADCSARGQTLELALELELRKCIDLFGYMNVITVGDIALIGDARNDSKATLKCLTECVRR